MILMISIFMMVMAVLVVVDTLLIKKLDKQNKALKEQNRLLKLSLERQKRGVVTYQ